MTAPASQRSTIRPRCGQLLTICPSWSALWTRRCDVSIWNSFLNMFTPGANPPPTYTQATIPRYRNILVSGRGLHSLTEPHEMESILVVLLPEGLFLRAFVDIEGEADELLKKAIRPTNDRQRGKT